jgi:hypothetical protein
LRENKQSDSPNQLPDDLSHRIGKVVNTNIAVTPTKHAGCLTSENLLDLHQLWCYLKARKKRFPAGSQYIETESQDVLQACEKDRKYMDDGPGDSETTPARDEIVGWLAVVFSQSSR